MQIISAMCSRRDLECRHQSTELNIRGISRAEKV